MSATSRSPGAELGPACHRAPWGEGPGCMGPTCGAWGLRRSSSISLPSPHSSPQPLCQHLQPLHLPGPAAPRRPQWRAAILWCVRGPPAPSTAQQCRVWALSPGKPPRGRAGCCALVLVLLELPVLTVLCSGGFRVTPSPESLHAAIIPPQHPCGETVSGDGGTEGTRRGGDGTPPRQRSSGDGPLWGDTSRPLPAAPSPSPLLSARRRVAPPWHRAAPSPLRPLSQRLLLPRQRRRADAAGAVPPRRPPGLRHPPARAAAAQPGPRRGGLRRHHQQLHAPRLHRGQRLRQGVGRGAAGRQDGRGPAGLLGTRGGEGLRAGGPRGAGDERAEESAGVPKGWRGDGVGDVPAAPRRAVQTRGSPLGGRAPPRPALLSWRG